ncbi:MAG TPA: type IX secretion system membrane protein PorP/SprF [Cytophagaceae bacterium]|nr:type IX secretion system membrane protein PorP/SprF [Cytophagaceae bacterium]
MQRRITGLLLLFFLVGYQAFAQDIQFSQFYAVPLYQNPAFAGSAHALRATVHNRLQWPGIGGATSGSALSKYTTSYFAVDNFWSQYRSGVALQVLRDWQAGSTLSSTQVGLQYAYELPISPTFTFRPGLEVDYMDRSVDYSKLRFPDDFNNQNGWDGNIQTGNPRRQFIDVSSGGVLYSEKLWAGVSFNHINNPNESLTGQVSRLPMKFNFMGGYKIYLKDNHYLAYLERAKEVSLTPTFNYKAQGKSDQFDLGVYLIYDQLMAGAWYRGIPFKKYPDFRNNESLVALIGWKYQSISIGYSYDFTVSKLQTVGTGGAHELNITYVHHKSKKYKPMKRLPCPSFYKN